MNKDEALTWLLEHFCSVGEYDGEDFVVVEPQSKNPIDDPVFFTALHMLDIEEDNFGYGDEYTECTECGKIIRTSPTHACWTPDFWENTYDGELLCNACTKGSADAYFEWLMKEATEGVAHTCVLNPGEHGFTKVIEDLEYGCHPDQNDDPRKLIAWAIRNDLCIAFDVRQNPFTATYDVWVKDRITNAPIDVEQIRKTLLESGKKYSHLRRQFREWPTPEEQLKRALRHASEEEEQT